MQLFKIVFILFVVVDSSFLGRKNLSGGGGLPVEQQNVFERSQSPPPAFDPVPTTQSRIEHKYSIIGSSILSTAISIVCLTWAFMLFSFTTICVHGYIKANYYLA
jgi:hypothetical protein